MDLRFCPVVVIVNRNRMFTKKKETTDIYLINGVSEIEQCRNVIVADKSINNTCEICKLVISISL